MSLINDALKRAREAQLKSNPDGTPPLRPAEARRGEWDLGRILPVIIIFLIIAALFFIGLAVARRTGKTDNDASEAGRNRPAGSANGTGLPEPATGPAAGASAGPKTNQLQGIAYDPVHPWAIISGKTVLVGDLADGLRVTAILPNTVTLAGRGQTNTLTLRH